MVKTEIVIYDKVTYQRVRSIPLDGEPIENQEKALDKVAARLDWSKQDYILICPENKPPLQTFDGFVEAIRAAKPTPSILTKSQCLRFASMDGITQPFAVPSKNKTMVLPAKLGTVVYIHWTTQKSPSGERLYRYENRSFNV